MSITKSYVDFTSLGRYDEKIKLWANSASQDAYKTVIKSADGNYLYFFKKPNAVITGANPDTPDVTITLGGGDEAAKLDALAAIIDAAASYDDTTEVWTINLDSNFTATTVVGAINELLDDLGDVSDLDVALTGETQPTNLVAAANLLASHIAAVATDLANLDGTATIATESDGVVTIKGGIAQTAGEIDNDSSSDITLAKVATTGAAEDVSTTAITDGAASPTTLYSAGDVQGTLESIARNLNNLTTDAVVTMRTVSSADYANVYELYQGDDGTYSSTNLIGSINIPKDMVVSSGIVVDVVFVAAHDEVPASLHEGSASGTDVTEEIKGTGVTPTSADAGKYIKLTIANAAQSHLWIKATDLVDIYTGGTTTEITVSINNNVITATVGDIDASKLTYITATTSSIAPVARESVKQALERLDGADTVTGSVAKKIKDAIGGLDTSSDVGLVSEDSVTGAVTFTASLAESDGVVSAGSAESVVFTPITTAEVDTLFT